MTTKNNAKVELARMVWPEVEELVASGAVAMVPLASIEPSGRHSVMGGEIHIVDHFCEKVAKRTNAFYLPCLPFGYARTFMGFPGTISLKPATLEAAIFDVATSILDHGFSHVLIVNNHSGNEAIVEQAARRVREETGTTVASVLLPPIMKAVATDLYDDLAAVHGHGGEPGASVRLHLTPDDMRLDLARPTEVQPYQGLGMNASNVKGPHPWKLHVDYHETNVHGGTGDPSAANADKGAAVLERLVEAGVRIVEAFRNVDTRAKQLHRPIAGAKDGVRK
jgi:creatinine amidohydrolase